MIDKVLEDYPVTAEAIKNAEKIFGKDMCEIKAKTTRNKPQKLTITYYDLPKEIVKKYKDVAIEADIFFVNRMPMLISRSDKIKFLTVSFIENRTKRTRFNLLKTVANMHSRKGFKVRVIKADGEFEDLTEPFAAPERAVDMNMTIRDEHTDEIERIVRVVKERTRATCARLPNKKEATNNSKSNHQGRDKVAQQFSSEGWSQ